MKTSTFAIAAIVSILAVNTVFATGELAVTSKGYVDTEVGKKQNTIPVAGTNTSNSGTSVVMYTGTAGTIGERGIFSSGTYTDSDANKLVTASALNNSVNSIPEITTSKLTCANNPDCTLWTVSDQTVYGNNSNNNGGGN